MNQNDIKYNASGYRDKVAETAIRKADRTSSRKKIGRPDAAGNNGTC